MVADYEAGLPLISADRVQLSQVMLNFVMNGCEAMDDANGPRRLLVRTRRVPSGNVEVTVADRGPGIAPADLEGIFEPFVSTKRHGVGLGLAICRTIVDAHGGQDLGDQQSRGRRDVALRNTRGAEGRPSMEASAIVYVVDDDEDVRKALARLLTSAGSNVVTFESPRAFLDGFDRTACACLVLDLAMPGVDGLELQRMLEHEARTLAHRISSPVTAMLRRACRR